MVRPLPGEPLKSGELKSDDLVWIYIANETSPLVAYKTSIAKIAGKHYRLDDAQWKYLCEKFRIDGIPSYVLVDRDGRLTPYRIPRLKDMLEWGKDKVVFNFDNKYINTKGVSDEVRKASLDYYIRQLRPGGDWSMYHNIMLSVRSLDEAMYYWNAGIRNVMFCCEISSREMFDAYDACPIPWDYIMAYIRLSVDPRLQEVYDLLHERGVSTMTSITGSSDKVKNPRDRRVCYLRDLVSEPDLIETDYPSEFVDLPRSRAEIHALQDRAIEGNRSVKADKAKKNRRK